MSNIDIESKIYKNFNSLYKKNLDLIIIFLNDYHKLNLSQLHWEIIVGPWLRHYLLIYINFENNFTLNKSKIIDAKLSDEIDWEPPLDYKDFVNTSDNKIFYKNIYLKLNYFKFKKIKNNFSISFKKNKKCTSKIFSKDKINFFFKVVKNLINITYITAMMLIFREKSIVMTSYGIGNKDKLKYSIKSFGKIIIYPNLLHIYQVIDFVYFYNFNKNKILTRSFCLQKYSLSINDEIIFKLIITAIPISYLEKFYLLKKINSLFFSITPKNVYSDAQHYMDEFFKFSIAKWSNNGTKILIAQHSGRAGFEKYDVLNDHNLSICNKFYSWGWEGISNKVYPSKSLRLSRQLCELKQYSFKKANKITFVMSGLHEFQGEVLGYNFKHSRNILLARENLFEKIYNNKFKNFMIRKRDNLFLNDIHTLENYKKYKFKYVNSKDSILNTYKESKLIIFERISTGLFECISMNIPVIFYKSKFTSDFDNPVHSDLINRLSNAKILYQDPDSLVNFIKSNQIQNWWEDSEIKKEKDLIISKFALTTSKYTDYWIKKLNE